LIHFYKRGKYLMHKYGNKWRKNKQKGKKISIGSNRHTSMHVNK